MEARRINEDNTHPASLGREYSNMHLKEVQAEIDGLTNLLDKIPTAEGRTQTEERIESLRDNLRNRS